MSDMQQEAQELIDALTQLVGMGEAPTQEQIEDVLSSDVLEGVGRDEYVAAMDEVVGGYGVTPEHMAPVYEELDAGGDYSPAAIHDNLKVLFENEDVTNTIDNSLEVGDYAHVHGGVDQHNETNVANATGDGAIAGRDQDGQFQTGDGVQSGDYNEGVVNQGENSGQIAGGVANAEDITTGDGNFNNEGNINDSAIAFGGGDATVQADDVIDHSISDSYNADNVGNVADSYNADNVGNVDHTAESTYEESLHADVDVTDSFKTDDDGHDIDDSYNTDGDVVDH